RALFIVVAKRPRVRQWNADCAGRAHRRRRPGGRGGRGTITRGHDLSCAVAAGPVDSSRADLVVASGLPDCDRLRRADAVSRRWRDRPGRNYARCARPSRRAHGDGVSRTTHAWRIAGTRRISSTDSSSADDAGSSSTLTTPTAYFTLRPSAKFAMFTWCRPRIVPTSPITPG